MAECLVFEGLLDVINRSVWAAKAGEKTGTPFPASFLVADKVRDFGFRGVLKLSDFRSEGW